MLERVQSLDAIDDAIQEIAAQEKALAAKQLIEISGHLAELAELAKHLVRPIEIAAGEPDQLRDPH